MKNKIDDKILPHFVVIESQILTDNRIKANEKLLYSYICLLTNNKKLSCFATSKYLASIFNVTDRQIRTYLKNLKKYGYINITIENNNKRIINTTINTFLEKRKDLNDELSEEIFNFDFNWLNEKDSE